MKIHTPAFIIGLLVFVAPFLGLPSYLETIVISAFGIAIMLIATNFNKAHDKVNPPTPVTDATNSQSPQN